MPLPLDRFLRHDELTAALHALAEEHPGLVTVEEYGRSHEGRPLWLVTVTDATTGPHHHKPAHWVDANIHSVEVSGGVAALALLQHLVDGHAGSDPHVTEALRTRAFYVAPRVNPDGVDAALADRPRYRRSSLRPWPWADRHHWPGLVEEDVDGDGRILTMRIPDPHGAWVEHPDDPRVMVAVPVDGVVDPGARRYRLLTEGTIVDFDGFTVPTPRAPEGLDLNRNFPAGWSTGVTGSGDHPLSEPEIDALVRAIAARPNICGYNAFHTHGGFVLRPSSTAPDSSLPPVDLWTWTELGARATELTGYPVHSVYEDLTWDRERLMSGAADDWAYEHLGVYSWTTEIWDVVHAATGRRASTHVWYVGPTADEELAVARWADDHGVPYEPWRPFEHPQLGAVEVGGADWFRTWTNVPPARLEAEVSPHARFAVTQALASPRLEVVHTRATGLGGGAWRVEVGVANTGWLPTTVTARAEKERLVRPIVAELDLPDGAEVVGGPNRRQLGQLEGRRAFRLDGGARSDGTPDRALATWVVRLPDGVTELGATAWHERAGRAGATVTLG